MSKKWDIAKCHRATRPLISKINGLNLLLDSHPSLSLQVGPLTSVRVSDDQTSNHRLSNNSRKYSSKRSASGSEAISYDSKEKYRSKEDNKEDEILVDARSSVKATNLHDIKTVPRSSELLALYKTQVAPEIWLHYQALYTTFVNFLQQSYVPKTELFGLKRLSVIKVAYSMSMTDGTYDIESWLDCNEMISPYRQLLVATYGIHWLCKEINSCRDILPVLMLVCHETGAEDFCTILIRAFLTQRTSRIPCCVASEKGFIFVLELIGPLLHDTILSLLIDADIQNIPFSPLASIPSFNESQYSHAIQLLLQFRRRIKQPNDGGVELTLRVSENISWLCKGCLSKHYKIEDCRRLIDLIPPSGSLKDLRKLLELRIACYGNNVLGFSLLRFLTAGPGRTMAVHFFTAFEAFKELTEGILMQHPYVAQSMCELYIATLSENVEPKDTSIIKKWCTEVSEKCDRMTKASDHNDNSIYIPSSDMPSSSPSLMARYIENTPQKTGRERYLSEKKPPCLVTLSESPYSSPFYPHQEEAYGSSPARVGWTKRNKNDYSYLGNSLPHKTDEGKLILQRSPIFRAIHSTASPLSVYDSSKEMSESPIIRSRKRSHFESSLSNYSQDPGIFSSENRIEEDDISFRNLSRVHIYSSPSIASPVFEKRIKLNEPVFQKMIKDNNSCIDSPSKRYTGSSSKRILKSSINGMNIGIRPSKPSKILDKEFNLLSDDDLCAIKISGL